MARSWPCIWRPTPNSLAWAAPRPGTTLPCRQPVHADQDASGHAWAELWRREGIGELMLHHTELTPAQRAGLVVAGAQRQLVVGDAQWWRLPRATP